MKLFSLKSLPDTDSKRLARERAYLDQSVSMVDLERRQREIDGGAFRRR
jgi:hypothetical protein